MTYNAEREWRRKNQPFYDAEYELLLARARECMLFGVSPEYYDQMTMKEVQAWRDAYKQLNQRSAFSA